MAKTTSKTTFSTKKGLPDKEILRTAQSGRDDLADFLESLGGVRCRNHEELKISTDTLLLEGAIRRASRQLDSLMRKARKAGLSLRKVAA